MARQARRVTADQAKDAAANAAVEEMVHKPEHQAVPEAPGRPALPYAIEPRFGRNFDRVVDIIFDESFDVTAAYEELEASLDIEEALTPAVVRAELKLVEKRAFNAHRLYVTAKVELERYEIDCGVAIGAMREKAIASLQQEKDGGTRSKQITDADVKDKAAIMYPDEWREMNVQLEKAKKAVSLLENLSERWANRRYSLSAMIGGNRT